MQTMAIKINRRVRGVEGSSTLAITAKAKELKAKGVDVVTFAAGEPDFDTPDSIKQAAIKAIQSGFTKYTPSTGTVELREVIAKKFKKDNNLDYKPNQIVVSCGAKHCIYDIIQVLADEGEEVIIPTPYWVSYPEMVKLAGAQSVFMPTTAKSNFKITAAQLKQFITPKSKILILNSPSNPTGMVYTRAELEAIAKVCVENNLYVISDDIYEKLIYTDTPFTTIASLNKDIYNLTITVNGVSKAYSMTGWRIGYCAGPQEIMDYIKNFQDHSTSNPTSISQAASLQALSESDETVNAMRDEYKKRRNLMASLLDKIPQISYIMPDGAFYMFCDFNKIGPDATAMAKKMLDEVNVAVIPGESFGAPGFVRLSFATSVKQIEEGIRRIGEWVKRQ